MNTENMKEQNYENLKCIWMSSNLIEYKLCDKNFDCDNCVFDKVMRNLFVENSKKTNVVEDKSSNIFEKVLSKINVLEFPERLFYLKNNLTAKHLFSRTYSLSLSGLSKILLDNISVINLPKSGTEIKKGDVIVELMEKWGQYSIKSPINFNLLNCIKTHNDISQNDWNYLIETDLEELNSARISKGEYQKNIINLTRKLFQYERSYSEIGITMTDGGKNVNYLYEAVGSNEYKNLLNLLFDQI
ncbi:MAG: hypothetical protein STSR0008_17400 [Ignavibacterium sp.]